MTPFEVKVFMMENGLTISGMARELADNNATEASLRVMISDMIYGRKYYPNRAKQLADKFNLQLSPIKQTSVREIVKRAA